MAFSKITAFYLYLQLLYNKFLCLFINYFINFPISLKTVKPWIGVLITEFTAYAHGYYRF